MDFSLTPEELRFRDALRTWLADNAPPAMPLGDQASFELRREWQRELYEAGWMGVAWPEQYGGGGGTRMDHAIVLEELARARAPRPANQIGMEMGGPTIIAHGTEEQKQRWLRPLLTADEIWCQAFSEPDAGSDVAAIRTRAKRVDGGWSVTGQKIWTSLAADAKWCMLLCRTDTDAQAHRGLSFLILDMEAAGIEVRPIVQITGESEFNELFLDDAFVPDEHVLGDIGQGWTVALTTLMNERAGIALSAQVEARVALDQLSELVNENGGARDPLVQDRLADLYVGAEALRLLTYRGLAEIERDGKPGPRGSLAKLQWAAVNQGIGDLAMEVSGPGALDPESPWGYHWLRSRANSIEGGTTEILQNIIAERVLGLPRLR